MLAWTKTNFRSSFIFLQLSIARSSRRNGTLLLLPPLRDKGRLGPGEPLWIPDILVEGAACDRLHVPTGLF